MFDFLFKKRERLPLPYKRELHCHIIPGVDDGSSELEYSMHYLKSLSEFGVEKVIFTPHRTEPNFMNTPKIIDPIFEQVKAEVAVQQIPVECEGYSFEYRVDEGFLQMMQESKWGEADSKLRPLHGHYILIENAWSQPLAGLDRAIEMLQEKGYYVILAHPERYLYYHRHNYRAYEHLQDMQVEFQCNVLSFSGYYGPEIKKAAMWMLEQGYIGFMGSDLHNKRHTDLIEKFLSSKEYHAIREDLVPMINNDRI